MPVIRFLAQILSVVFHPLFLVTYLLCLLLILNPYLFGVNHWQDQGKLILLIFVSTAFMPGISIFIMKALGLVTSVTLRNAKERIGPYIATAIFYTWMFRNLLDNPEIPKILVSCILGATIGLFLDFIINNFSKISAHATGMGGLVAVAIIILIWFNPGSFFIKTGVFGNLQISMLLFLIFSLLIAGAVCTARLILKAHSLQEVAGGFLVGFCAQWLAFQIMI